MRKPWFPSNIPVLVEIQDAQPLIVKEVEYRVTLVRRQGCTSRYCAEGATYKDGRPIRFKTRESMTRYFESQR